jgi:hypothetical protein
LPEPEQVHALDDLQVASYLINPSQGDHSLADLAIKHGFVSDDCILVIEGVPHAQLVKM